MSHGDFLGALEQIRHELGDLQKDLGARVNTAYEIACAAVTMTHDPSPSDCEAARIVQETADVLADDLGIDSRAAWRRGVIRHAIAEAVERWRIYARGGEQSHGQTTRETAHKHHGPSTDPAGEDAASSPTDRAQVEDSVQVSGGEQRPKEPR